MDQLVQLFGVQNIDSFSLASTSPWAYGGMLFLSIIYGVCLNLLYGLYFRESEPRDVSLARSLILLTPSLMSIFWVIQLSLPLSVGLLGTLSFVRFRSPVKRAEDIAFIVITLACAISCAILKPLMGGGLILLFLAYALIRNNFLSQSSYGSDFAVLTYNTKESRQISEIESILKLAKCKKYEFVSSRTYDGITSFVFNLAHIKKDALQILTKGLEDADKNSNISIFYPNGRIGV